MKVKFANTTVGVHKLKQGSVVYSENLDKFYYIKGFKWLMDDTPILKLSNTWDGSPYFISTPLLTWLEPHD